MGCVGDAKRLLLLGRVCEFASVCGIEWLEIESTDEAEEDKVQPVFGEFTCYRGPGDGLPLGAPLYAYLCQACRISH